jgi:hypothetical protein
MVESSLSVPTIYAGKLRWQTTGMFSEAVMANHWDAGSLWMVIIPKSKDRFMERPPMKTVQP